MYSQHQLQIAFFALLSKLLKGIQLMPFLQLTAHFSAKCSPFRLQLMQVFFYRNPLLPNFDIYGQSHTIELNQKTKAISQLPNQSFALKAPCHYCLILIYLNFNI
jgi:hypothetical protein